MLEMPAKLASADLVMETLRRTGPASQAAIARQTGLSRATVNNLIQRLATEGLVESQQVNGRETLVSLRSGHGVFVTAQVRARGVRVAVFDFGQSLRTEWRSALDPGDKGSTSPALVGEAVSAALAKAGLATSAVTGAAIALEGPILKATGAIASWAWQRLPGWKDIPVERALGEQLAMPTLVDNDANLSALAEWTWGSGRGCEDFLYVTASEGVGGGLIINGRIYHGGSGLAGEIGHMVVEETGGLCFCGSRGCLSGFASERAILAALAASDPDKTTLIEVIEAAKAGDAACQRVLFEAGRHLGKALAAAARVIAPSMITIGGILGTAERFVFEGLESSAEIINLRTIAPPITFRLAEIGEDEVILGALAAALARAGQGASQIAPWMQGAAPVTALPA